MLRQDLLRGKHEAQRQPEDSSSRKQRLHEWPYHLYWESHSSTLGLQEHLKFKSNTYRCLVFMKGQVKDKIPRSIQEEIVQSLNNQPIKCLGKWCDASLKDHTNVNRLRQQAKVGMETIEKTQLLGKHKALMNQHGLLPRLTLPWILYETRTGKKWWNTPKGNTASLSSLSSKNAPRRCQLVT